MDKILSLEGAKVLYDDTRERLDSTKADLKTLDSRKIDGARVSEDGKYLYLTSNEQDVAGPYGPFSGSGGGGSDNDAKLSLTNLSGSLPSTISKGSSFNLSIKWSSIENEVATGPGTFVLKVNDSIIESTIVEQGIVTRDLKNYLALGDNTIKITLTDVYGNIKTLALMVKTVTYTLDDSRFDSSVPFEGNITYIYTAKGEGTKTMHFLIDGEEVLTKDIVWASREDSVVLDALSHGSHYLDVYFTVEVGGVNVYSETKSYDLICYEKGNSKTIITSSARSIETNQYSNFNIPYYVFNTISNTVDVELLIDGEKINTLSKVGRTQQIWASKANTSGTHIYTIKSGDTLKNIDVVVKPVDIEISAETQNLTLHLSAENRSNSEPEPQRSTWEYGGIKAQFENFNWISDGWVLDSDSITTLRVKDDARVTIPYKPFATSSGNIKNTGKTLEFEFATSGVFKYDAEIISCYSNGIGFKITAQQALYSSSVSTISAQYKENEHIRVSFVINSSNNNRLIYCYINGIISGIVRYPSTDIFYQNPEVEIKIGSSDAIVDLYRIRIYDKDLSRFQVVNNWISDMQDGEQLVSEYNRNTIYDDSDNLSLDLIKSHLPNLPYMVVYTDKVTDKKGNLVGHLSTRKGEKLLVSGYYTDPVNPQNSFSWKNGEIDVQGTSSQAYPIKNFKLKIKRSDTYLDEATRQPTDCSGFIMTKLSEEEGAEHSEKKYPLRGYDENGKALSVKENTFVFKADFASSEGCNNVELVRFYNDVCSQFIYKTPAQEKDDKVRQGIDGFPIVWFEEKNGKLSFIGKYNFNNHKGTEDTYGLDYHGETFEEVDGNEYYRLYEGAPDESWEFTDNNNEIALFKRVAGDTTKTIVKDSSGKTTTYDAYLSEDNLSTIKEQSLNPLYLGTHSDISNGKYTDWSLQWREEYSTLEEWIEGLYVLNIHLGEEGFTDEINEQRSFITSILKRDLRKIYSLTEAQTQITPEEDMLGEYGEGESVAHAFEVRFPSEWYDAHTDSGKFLEVVKTQRFVELQKWIVSTDPDQATNNILENPIVISGTTYDKDTSEYRLAKFKKELDSYFNKNDTLFYYLYTEMFLMIDSRVKNAFPSYYAITHQVPAINTITGTYDYEECGKKDVIEEGKSYFVRAGEGTDENPYTYTSFEGNIGDLAVDNEGNKLFTYVLTEEETLGSDGRPLGRWCWLPYDMDTGIGINNEGLLVFDYSLEDTEALIGTKVVKIGTSGAENAVPVYNGASSTLWNNIRKCFSSELTAMYQDLRGNALFNYDTIENRYEEHQYLWPAAIFNEDAYYKYIQPLLTTGEDRLGMCLGSKEQQRKWWLYNRFRFLDSKYVAGDAVNYRINFRTNGLMGDKNIKITPYIDLYIKVKTGEGWESVPVKVYRDQATTVHIDLNTTGDTEAYIYSADQIKEIEGLNQSLNISTLDISSATNLQHLDVSSKTSNTTLAALTVGANRLLRTIDARNCNALGDTSLTYSTTAVDLSQCEQLEEAYFNGTSLSTVTLPEGGRLRTVYLPSSITTLNIENQKKISNIQILNSEGEWDTSNLKTLIVSNVNTETQYIVLNIIKTLEDGSFLEFHDFDIDIASKSELESLISKLFTLRSENSTDNSIPELSGTIHLTSGEPISYEYYNKIVSTFKDVTLDCEVTKTVKFYNYNGTVLLDTQETTENSASKGSVVYRGIDPTKPEIEKIYYSFDGWSYNIEGELEEDALINIETNRVLYSHFKEIPIYRVHFYSYDGSTEIYEGRTLDVGDVEYNASIPSYEDAEFGKVNFLGWGTVKYGGADLQFENNKILNVSCDINAYSIMDWPIISFEITKAPNRVHYWAKKEGIYDGDLIDLEGIVVTSTKNTPMGHQEAELLVYEYEPSSNITENDHSLVITTEGRVDGITTKISRETPIYLAREMSVLTESNQSVYFLGDSFNLEGLSFQAVFEDSTSEVIDNLFLSEGLFSVTPEIINNTSWNNVNMIYKGFSLKTKAFGVKDISVLEDTDWETISAISKAGLAENWWSVGDIKTIKGIKSPSSLGYGSSSTGPTLISWSDKKAIFRIIAFNHNKEIESNNQNTTTFELSEFELTLEKFEIVDTLPEESALEANKSYIFAIKIDESAEIYNVYYYFRNLNESGTSFKFFYLGKGERRLIGTSTYALITPIRSVYSGGYMSYPNLGGDDSGIKYSWNRGCNLKDICKAYEEALPTDLQAAIVEVTKSQRDVDYEDYPWPLDQSVTTERMDAHTVIKSQKERIYIANWMELSGEGKAHLWSTVSGSESEADESLESKQFEYYKLGDSDRRIRFQLGSNLYTSRYPTRSYAAFRWVPVGTGEKNTFLNYYAYVTGNGYLEDSSWGYSDQPSPMVPIFTV